MNFRDWIYLFFLFVIISSCNNGCVCSNCETPEPETVAIHNPIFPDSNAAVTFTLFLRNETEIKSVNLKVYQQNLDLSIDPPDWSTSSLMKDSTWTNPVNFPLTYPNFSGYEHNTYITYIFTVEPADASYPAYSHEVSFATRPYAFSETEDPTLSQPAPVYVTADADYACNVVFIPDDDLDELERMTDTDWEYYFFNSIRNNILNGIFEEPTTKNYISGFNFYINKNTGEINSERSTFEEPSNMVNLNFAQGKSFVHNRDFIPFSSLSASNKSYSSRIYNVGTFMHESGHTIFLLYDEYAYGKHYESVGIPINNWSTEAGAQAAAPSFGLTSDHVYKLNESTECYILCPFEGCQMGMCGLGVISYCRPCSTAVDYWMYEFMH